MPTQLVSCEGTRVPQGTKDEFWQGIDRADQTNFPPQRFLTKAMVSRQRLTKWWVGLKMDLKTFLTWFFVRQHLPAKKSMWHFRSISLKLCSVTQESWVNVKRGIMRRNWRCNFCRATARVIPSIGIGWKNEPVQTLSQTHADVELEQAGESWSMCEVLCATPSA
jgi:hypothetical protein